MPAKQPFSKAQYAVLLDAAKRARRKFKSQEEMALALDITQPAVSALLKGRWKPGLSTARHIAAAVGMQLEELIGDFEETTTVKRPSTPVSPRPNLEVCVAFHAEKRTWSPWTLAAARAGVFGPTDFAAPEWSSKLDALESVMTRFQKGAAP